jgi:hypothetical protein
VSPSYEPVFVVKHLFQEKGNIIKMVKMTLRKYIAGGIPISAGECGLRHIRCLIPPGTAASYPIWWDQANSKLRIYSAIGVELGNEDVDVSGVIIYTLAVGY